ncbi:hypothetical protein QNJ95_37205 [Bradyrhizobium elkanii]|uniref:hypothetical protein n=1 Tax=Bradyrhizobium elkanii TaxID=29448 RepID=UPI002711FAFD|nr:hypothetical protein [Bradyrhizobium elkanii]WLA38519.1 hypothetical protein QNJ95_37205 [Bradyrhizobium elkanii]
MGDAVLLFGAKSALFRVSNEATLKGIIACVPVILLAGRIAYATPSPIIPSSTSSTLGAYPAGARISDRIKSRTAVSRIEGSKRRPSLNAIFLCMLIFNMPALELFPRLMSELRTSILARARELYEELQGDPSKATRLKLNFLERLLERIGPRRLETSV